MAEEGQWSSSRDKNHSGQGNAEEYIPPGPVLRDAEANGVKQCPSCAKGKHSAHQYDYLHDGRVTLCRCSCRDLPYIERKKLDKPSLEQEMTRLGLTKV